eukprot:4954656-Prymnesium_polylepis.1
MAMPRGQIAREPFARTVARARRPLFHNRTTENTIRSCRILHLLEVSSRTAGRGPTQISRRAGPGRQEKWRTAKTANICSAVTAVRERVPAGGPPMRRAVRPLPDAACRSVFSFFSRVSHLGDRGPRTPSDCHVYFRVKVKYLTVGQGPLRSPNRQCDTTTRNAGAKRGFVTGFRLRYTGLPVSFRIAV